MRPFIVLVVLTWLVAAPLALAGHAVNHLPANELEPVTALVEMATDGYVFEISRPGERVFEVRVLHRQSFFEVGSVDPWASPLGQYALDRVDVLGPASRACATAAACGNQGLWLHGLRLATGGVPGPCPNPQLPTQGCYAPQTLEVLSDGAATYLRITLNHDFEPAFSGAAIAVAELPCTESLSCQLASTSWARGFYNTAKLALPLDVLDAVPEIVRIN